MSTIATTMIITAIIIEITYSKDHATQTELISYMGKLITCDKWNTLKLDVGDETSQDQTPKTILQTEKHR